MNYDEFKTKVFKLAKKAKMTYLLPGNNDLYLLWEQKKTPEEVVNNLQRKPENEDKVG